MKKKLKQILSALLVAVMLVGVMPIMSFAVSDAPTFSVLKLSETDDEVKISFNLESGCFGSLDLQINASDYNSANKTTGLTLVSIEKGQGYIEFCEANEYPIFALNKTLGIISFASSDLFNQVGSFLVYTFTKSGSSETKLSDFMFEISSCTNSQNKSCSPTIINKIDDYQDESDDKTPIFSISKLSETNDEVKISFNLESGCFDSMDWQINAIDYNSADKTTGLTLVSMEIGQSYKEFYEAHEYDKIIAMNKNNGMASFATNFLFDQNGSFLIYTFSKTESAKGIASTKDFFVEIRSCTKLGTSYNPIVNFSWEDEESVLDSLYWKIEEDHAVVYGCKTDYVGDIVIPSEINGYPVTEIGKDIDSEVGFENCKSLTGITFPEYADIYNLSFSGCDNLKKIVIPDNIKSIYYLNIDGTAYYNDKSNWDNDVLYVGNHLITSKEDISGACSVRPGTILIANSAFEYRNNLTKIIIPNSVKSIGSYAFLSCDNLSDITLPNRGDLYLDRNAFDGTKYYNDSSNWENGVLYIGNHLVAANSDLKGTCNVKYGTKTIVDQAFSSFYDGDTELTGITFPETLERIGDDAFWGSYIEEVVIPDSVTYLGNDAFWSNSDLKKVKLSNNLKNVSAFGMCDSLEEIVIPAGVTEIGNGGFVFCENLNSIVIPKSVTCIGIRAFCECNSLKDVYYSGSEEEWNEIKIKEYNDPLINATVYFNSTGHVHTFNHITVPSTCKVAGMEYDICSECGETFDEKTLLLAAHTWGEWTVVKEATTTAEGQEKRTCSVCGEVETRAIEKLKVIKDDKTGIEINYNDEYDSDTEIKVEEQFSGKSFQLINTEFGKVNSKIYDIATYKDGVKVQPNGEITVKVPLPDGFTTNKVFVCYVDSVSGKVTKIPCEVKDGYVIFKTNHFSEYAIVEQSANVKSVSVSDITLNYKKSATIKPTIKADEGAKYTVKYSSSNTKVATVDENGKVYAAKKGNATIICTVTDSNGDTVQDTCKVTVKYSFGQWLIKILLFGWIWY